MRLFTAVVGAGLFLGSVASAQTTKAPPKDAPAKGEPQYRYVEVPFVKPGSGLYAYMENSQYVPVATDIFAHNELLKSILAGDKAGIDELKSSGRAFSVEMGTPVRILQLDKGLLAKAPSYEVRVLDGKHDGKKGWVAAIWLRHRIEVPAGKAKAKRKRR